MKNEPWEILPDEEEKAVWDIINSEFHFNPSGKADKTFTFPFEVNCYDIDYQKCDNNPEFDEIVKNIFRECMGNDEWMYALDWQHTCFHYNPRVKDENEYPVFHEDKRYDGDGYEIYFPEFYPNGDFYFFIAKDLSWGWLGHPWKAKVWIYGKNLRNLIEKNAERLGLTLTDNEQ